MSKQNGRRPGHDPVLTPEYEDEIPVANKITIAPHTSYERTILLHRPKGKENRRKMARLFPFVGKLEELVAKANNNPDQQNMLLAGLIGEMWADDILEDELIPFVFQIEKNDPYLELLEIPDIVGPFLKAVRYISTSENSQELQDAIKKSEGEEEKVEEA